MIFISAGHNSKSHTIKQDPGAINSDGIKEGDLTIEFRDLVKKELDKLGVKYISDSDEESLAMYLSRIQTGKSSVVVEYHFDAGSSEVNGTSAIIGADADRLDKMFASVLSMITSATLTTYNRGVISETDSHRGRLGLMREQGVVCLVELCFITSPSDLMRYHKFKEELAHKHAATIFMYENML